MIVFNEGPLLPFSFWLPQLDARVRSHWLSTQRGLNHEDTYSTPKLGVVASGDDRPLAIRAQGLSDEVESRDQFLAVRRVQSVFGPLAHGDDEDVAVMAVQGEVWVVDYGGGHACSCSCYFLSWYYYFSLVAGLIFGGSIIL